MTTRTDPIGDGLGAAARLMLADRAGLRQLDASPDAVRLSFLGLALMVAIDASAAALQWDGLAEPARTKLAHVVGSSLLTLATYAAMLAVVVLFCRDAGTRPLLPAFVAAQNWATAVFSAATLPLVWFILGAGGGLAVLLYLALVAMAFVAWLRVVRIVLDQPAGRAAIITAASFVAWAFVPGILAPVLIA